MKISTGILCTLLFIACNNSNNTNEGAPQTIHANAGDTIITSAKPVVFNGCYEMTLKKDSAFLQIQLTDSTVSGNLDYHWYQKDSNNGTIKGVVRDSLLIAAYTFQSEGVTSVREVIFKIHDQELWPAFGGLTPHNDTLVFKDKNNLQYDNKHPFIKINCR
jgi:hypothetical protein